jgi:hypothetical protein
LAQHAPEPGDHTTGLGSQRRTRSTACITQSFPSTCTLDRAHRLQIKPLHPSPRPLCSPFPLSHLSSPLRTPHWQAPSIPRAAELEGRRRSRGRRRRFRPTPRLFLCSLLACLSSSARSRPHPAVCFFSGSTRASPSPSKPEEHADERTHAPPSSTPFCKIWSRNELRRDRRHPAATPASPSTPR